jgi:hypothetical protein
LVAEGEYFSFLVSGKCFAIFGYEIGSRKVTFSVVLTHPDDIEAEMGRRLSLTAITRDKGDSPSSSGLERHQGSHVDGIQRSNRYIFLNKLFSPIQTDEPTSTNSHRARSS